MHRSKRLPRGGVKTTFMKQSSKAKTRVSMQVNSRTHHPPPIYRDPRRQTETKTKQKPDRAQTGHRQRPDRDRQRPDRANRESNRQKPAKRPSHQRGEEGLQWTGNEPAPTNPASSSGACRRACAHYEP